MVQALVELDENTNRVLNIVKAKYGLKDKGDAIKYVVAEYIEYENEPELRPEFIKKMEEIKKQKNIKVDNLAERYSAFGTLKGKGWTKKDRLNFREF